MKIIKHANWDYDYVAAVGTTFNVISYDTFGAEHRVTLGTRLTTAERMCRTTDAGSINVH